MTLGSAGQAPAHVTSVSPACQQCRAARGRVAPAAGAVTNCYKWPSAPVPCQSALAADLRLDTAQHTRYAGTAGRPVFFNIDFPCLFHANSYANP